MKNASEMSNGGAIPISFVIITGGSRPASLERLLASIEKQDIAGYETVIVGNTGAVKRNNVLLLNEPELAKSAAICKMRNIGIEKARGGVIVLLDDDMELSENWGARMANRLNDNFDIASCRVAGPAGERWYDWAWASRGDPVCPPRMAPYDEVNKNIYISGCMMIIRRRVFDKIRFDNNLLNHQRDDVDFCHRAWDAGFALTIFPEVHAIHHLEPGGRSPDDPGGGPQNMAEGIYLFRMGRYREAIEIFNCVYGEQPVKSSYYTGLCMARLGLGDQADAQFKFVMKNADSDDVESRRLRYTASYHIGALKEEAGNFADALEYYNQALTGLPEHHEARKAVERLTQGKGS